MLAEAAAALSSLKAASDIARAMVDVRDASKLNSQIAELQQAIIAAQVQAITLAEKNVTLATRAQELEAECKRLTDWSDEAKCYEIRQIAAGVFVYMAIADTTSSLEHKIKLCPNCFNKRSKSILQQSVENPGRHIGLNCHLCRLKVVFDYYKE
jgi:hypothetical protein